MDSDYQPDGRNDTRHGAEPGPPPKNCYRSPTSSNISLPFRICGLMKIATRDLYEIVDRDR